MSSFLDGLNESIDEKIAEVEAPDYTGVPQLSKASKVAALIGIIVFALCLVIGYYTMV